MTFFIVKRTTLRAFVLCAYKTESRWCIHDERSFRVSTDIYTVITDHYDGGVRSRSPKSRMARQ